MTTESELREIESASLRAWPALEEVKCEGWTLRYSEGFTRRANSVQPVVQSGRPIADLVSQCEEWYGARGQPCIFRVTPFSQGGLDAYVADLGYGQVGRTHVLYRDVSDLSTEKGRTELSAAEVPEWLETFGRLSRVSEYPPAFRRILESIALPSLLAVLWAGDPAQAIGCGLAVQDGELLGLFDLVIDPEERRRGHGRELVRRMVSWGSDRGVNRVYLQVTEDNDSARHLYDKLGFHKAYDYWYRIGPTHPGR